MGQYSPPFTSIVTSRTQGTCTLSRLPRDWSVDPAGHQHIIHQDNRAYDSLGSCMFCSLLVYLSSGYEVISPRNDLFKGLNLQEWTAPIWEMRWLTRNMLQTSQNLDYYNLNVEEKTLHQWTSFKHGSSKMISLYHHRLSMSFVGGGLPINIHTYQDSTNPPSILISVKSLNELLTIATHGTGGASGCCWCCISSSTTLLSLMLSSPCPEALYPSNSISIYMLNMKLWRPSQGNKIGSIKKDIKIVKSMP